LTQTNEQNILSNFSLNLENSKKV